MTVMAKNVEDRYYCENNFTLHPLLHYVIHMESNKFLKFQVSLAENSTSSPNRRNECKVTKSLLHFCHDALNENRKK